MAASTRGWSVRLEGTRNRLPQLRRHERMVFCSRLAGILSVLDEYLGDWDEKLDKIDPMLRDYEFMPGDFNAVDSIRVIAERIATALSEVMEALKLKRE